MPFNIWKKLSIKFAKNQIINRYSNTFVFLKNHLLSHYIPDLFTNDEYFQNCSQVVFRIILGFPGWLLRHDWHLHPDEQLRLFLKHWQWLLWHLVCLQLQQNSPYFVMNYIWFWPTVNSKCGEIDRLWILFSWRDWYLSWC